MGGVGRGVGRAMFPVVIPQTLPHWSEAFIRCTRTRWESLPHVVDVEGMAAGMKTELVALQVPYANNILCVCLF